MTWKPQLHNMQNVGIKWLNFSRTLRNQVVDYYPSNPLENLLESWEYPDDEKYRKFLDVDDYELGEVNTITSKVRGYGDNFHKIILDIDHQAWLFPSSQEGHYHLYVDHSVTTRSYMMFLKAAANIGLIEMGYYQAAKRRGYTSLRLPWIKKEQ